MPGKTRPSAPVADRAMGEASMRPQRNAGENAGIRKSRLVMRMRFNEAPAKCRGKRSSRKRRNFAGRCFNEAPAKCRGKPVGVYGLLSRIFRFNEAPAKCRGKRTDCPPDRGNRRASMRPQRNAGENPDAVRVAVPRFDVASMRPQRNAGENDRKSSSTSSVNRLQ